MYKYLASLSFQIKKQKKQKKSLHSIIPLKKSSQTKKNKDINRTRKIAMEFSIAAISILLLLTQGIAAQAAIFDVTKYGAKADGKSDISQALMSAWQEACASTTPSSTVLIPGGTYLLTAVNIVGPCRAPVGILVQGTLLAPADPAQVKADAWITFEHIDQFTLSGNGILDGQGAIAWAHNDCSKNANCGPIPMNLRFNSVTNSVVRDITSKDSKNFHVNLLGCNNFSFQHFTISAPETSLNTDGIHIGRSTGVNITDTNIMTGDDCVSIGDGSQQINVERVTCGPGHGISIGSLGKYKGESPVVGVTVRNCTLTNTQNGVRLKSWPDSPAPGTASDMHFEDIIMNNVGNPVLIDQEYCPYNQCNLKNPSLVQISRVSFKKIRGTTSTKLAVKLVCSSSNPCQNVEVGDIDLTYTGKEGGAATSQCANIKPILSGNQNPATCNSAQSS
ncbi:exopolygalacturonase-like [Rhododendron vialii]|uniref:exopolygalacturonase-like n=1 Tax=Rhododendron vialii TaxID=182163 RepID=UPI0026601AF6|nr:exopolygalacturonase-like [Rhododendron vialii]